MPERQRGSSAALAERTSAGLPCTSGAGLKLRRLKVRNFKALDEVQLEFPAPLMPSDPDVIVIGSENGLGKTSVLEACALLTLAIADVDEFECVRQTLERLGAPDDPFGAVIRSGSESAQVEGVVQIGNDQFTVGVTLPRGDRECAVRGQPDRYWPRPGEPDWPYPSRSEAEFLQAVVAVGGTQPDPLTLAPLLYFHSYRRVQEGSLELGATAGDSRTPRWHGTLCVPSGAETPTSRFKVEVLRSMMGRASLFEGVGDAEANETLATLNTLMATYAGGRIEHLRPRPDNTVEFRVTPIGGGPTFSFDGLSSGQKEIISTLFLIWHHTRSTPALVLIDEPELHLNAEWHRAFIRSLFGLAPQNQYIMATHSEDVFNSVEQDRRILLERKAP